MFGSLILSGCAKKAAVSAAELPEPVATDWKLLSSQAIDGYNAPQIASPGPAAAPAPTPIDLSLPSGVTPRSAWTRAGVSRPSDIYAIGGVNRITVHHDGMPPARLSSSGDVAARIEQIRNSHVHGRGWADIGYHYVVDPNGRVWEGRNIRYQGAHVKDQNENNLGILCLGNFEVQRPSAQQLAALDRFLATQMTRYRIPMWRVKTHREVAQTECPGRNLQGYMVQTRAQGGQLTRLA